MRKRKLSPLTRMLVDAFKATEPGRGAQIEAHLLRKPVAVTKTPPRAAS